MTDLAILTAVVKTELQRLAKEQAALGNGLQNAAPGDKAGAPNKSVLYLLEGAAYLNEAVKKCEELAQSIGSASE